MMLMTSTGKVHLRHRPDLQGVHREHLPCQWWRHAESRRLDMRWLVIYSTATSRSDRRTRDDKTIVVDDPSLRQLLLRIQVGSRLIGRNFLGFWLFGSSRR